MICYLIASNTSLKESTLVNGCNAVTHNSPTWSPSILETMTSGSWNLTTWDKLDLGKVTRTSFPNIREWNVTIKFCLLSRSLKVLLIPSIRINRLAFRMDKNNKWSLKKRSLLMTSTNFSQITLRQQDQASQTKKRMIWWSSISQSKTNFSRQKTNSFTNFWILPF